MSSAVFFMKNTHGMMVVAVLVLQVSGRRLAGDNGPAVAK
jgi:hypothetical protein